MRRCQGRRTATTPNGELVSFTDSKNHHNNRYFTNGANGQAVGSFGQLTDENHAFEANFDVNYTPVSSRYPGAVPGVVVAQTGETLRTVAGRVWGDAGLWYLLAEENGLTDPDAVLESGKQLKVPNRVVSLANTSSSFKPFDVSQAIGDTTPTQPAPPQRKGGGCGVVGQILVIVVAIVVSIATYGALSGEMGAFAAGVVSGSAGSIASQGVGMAIGAQDSFDWKGVALGAIGGGVTAGLGASSTFSNAIKGLPEFAQTAVTAATGSALTQGIAVATGLQSSFSWREVAISAAAAPIARYAGEQAQSMSGLRFVGQMGSGAAGSLVRGAFGGKIDSTTVLADVFGNAIGNSIVEGMAPTSGAAGAGLQASRGGSGLRASSVDQLEEVQITARRLDNNPTDAIRAGGEISPDQRVAQEVGARRAAEAVQRIPDPPADLQALGEVVVTAPRELNPYAENFLQTRSDYYTALASSNWSTRQRASQTATYAPEIDRSLYVAPGFFKSAYDIAAAGFDDPNATLLDKGVYFLGAVGTALPMMVEEAGRFILNAPDSASVGGQLLARGNLATDTDTKVESYLGAVSSFSNAFNGFAALTPPSLMLPASVPNLSAVSSVTMSAEELAAVRATYAQDAAATMAPSRFSQLRGAATFLRDEALIIDPIKRREIIESFGPDLRLGSFEGQAYQYSGLQGTYSRYLTPGAVANPVRELALPPSNPALLLQQYTVAPTRALLGTAAPQNFGIPLPGGAQQIFIPSRDLLTPTLLLPTK